jgi:hypothetical protein
MRRFDHLQTYFALAFLVIVVAVASSGITWFVMRSPEVAEITEKHEPAWEKGYRNRVLKPNGRYEYACKIISERDGVLTFESYDSEDETFTKQTVSMPYQIEPDNSIHSNAAEKKGI